MIWRDHVFNYGPKSATRVTKFREKKLARQIMTARGVYSIEFCPIVGYEQDMVLIFLFALKGDP